MRRLMVRQGRRPGPPAPGVPTMRDCRSKASHCSPAQNRMSSTASRRISSSASSQSLNRLRAVARMSSLSAGGTGNQPRIRSFRLRLSFGRFPGPSERDPVALGPVEGPRLSPRTRLALARICAAEDSDKLPLATCCVALALALAARPGVSTGYLREPGRPNFDLGSDARRLAVISGLFAICTSLLLRDPGAGLARGIQGDGDRLLLRLAGGHFSLDVLADGRWAFAVLERHQSSSLVTGPGGTFAFSATNGGRSHWRLGMPCTLAIALICSSLAGRPVV